MNDQNPATFVVLLTELAALQQGMKRLETHILRLMNEAGISDEAIATVWDMSSQNVGKKRRRKL